MALVDNVLVCIIVLLVSVRGQPMNSSEGSISYDPDSIADNEKILRLFIQLASETANHLIRLKREINVHQASKLNCNKPATGTEVLTDEKNVSSVLGIDRGVKVPKQGQVNRNDSAASSGTSSSKSLSEQPIEIANRLMSDAKESNTSQAANVTSVPESAVPKKLSQKIEPRLAASVNGTVGIVGSGGRVENGTGGVASRNAVLSSSATQILGQTSTPKPQSMPKSTGEPSENGTLAPQTTATGSSTGQVPGEKLSHIPTGDSSTAKLHSGSRNQVAASGNGTLSSQAIVPRSTVRQVSIEQRSKTPIVPSSSSKIQSELRGKSGETGNGAVELLPLGKSPNNRTSKLASKNNIVPRDSTNPGLPIDPSRVISSIPSIVNGKIGKLVQLGLPSSLSQIPTGQVAPNVKGLTQVSEAVPFYRSILSLANPIASVPASVPPSGLASIPMLSGIPTDPKQVISSLWDFDGKLQKLLSIHPKSSANPNEPVSNLLQDAAVKSVKELNPSNNQLVGDLNKSMKPNFRSFLDVGEEFPGNNKTVNTPMERIGKNGSAVNSQLRPAVDNQLGTVANSRLKPAASMQLDSNVNSKLTTAVHSQLTSTANSQLDTVYNSQFGTVNKSQLGSAAKSQLGSAAKSQLGSAAKSQLGSAAKSQLDTVKKSQLGSSAKSQSGTVANLQSGSAEPNLFHIKLVELELQQYVTKFMDALRPLDSGKTSVSTGPAANLS